MEQLIIAALDFFPYTPDGNTQDGFFHEYILAAIILTITGLIGLFFGWLMWRNCKKRCAEIEKENARIRAKQRTA